VKLFLTTTLRILMASQAMLMAPSRSFAASTMAIQAEQDALQLAKGKISGILQKYCGDACELIDVKADVDEAASESEELGFESVSGEPKTKVNISRMAVDIQVDDRVSAADQERLGRLVTNAVKALTPLATVQWRPVAFPQIGVSGDIEDRIKQALQQRIHAAVQQTIDSYCAQECVLSNVGVDGKLVSPDEARGVPERELAREHGGRGIMRIENVDVDLSIDEKLPEANRSKIYNLIKAKTRFAFPINVNVSVVDFPESPSAKSPVDPWGLDRLRQTLQIFRDLAGTKEIITNTSQMSASKESKETSESKQSSELSKEKISASEKSMASEKMNSTNSSLNSSNNSSEKSSEMNAMEKKQGPENVEYMAYIAGFLVLAGIIAAVVMRLSSASRDAKAMIEEMPSRNGGANHNHGHQNQGNHNQGFTGQDGANRNGVGTQEVTPAMARQSLSLKMKIEALREELIIAFTDNPKVARDTFTRMLQEDGVEQTSKYVNIFGPTIIFDLMNDPNLQRDLQDLAEYYYKATFAFTDEQTLEILNVLRTRVTASEIRVMSRKRSEQFDFLQNLDVTQIYALISEEKPHVQSVLLTQMDPSRRRILFDMYEGEIKVALMRELCKADAIPKEYLANVAKALHKKVLSRTEFDTEQLRSSDIIIDLLEKSTLVEQRTLMADLVRTNPDSARAIKLKLVTVNMLPYIKDGHLLEIVMGLERDDLLCFLVGSPDNIRELLLSKAPAELAQSWLEDLESVSGTDDARYRMAEMRILGRVRNLANSGALRLVDINDRIFSEEQLAQIRRQTSQVDMAISRNSVAA
jgi:flagellar motor switch protein FliG